jgi:PST family polysaccharide transporter
VSDSKPDSYSQILKSTSIIGGASIINILVGLLRVKVVAVLLGPAGVGLIGLLQNLMATASTVSALGFGNVGTRQIAEAMGRDDQVEIDSARRALFWGTMLLGLLGGTSFWLLRDILALKILSDGSQGANIGWLAVGVMLAVAAGSQRALLNGMRRIGDIARVSVFSSLLAAILGVGAVWSWGANGVLLFVLAAPLSSFVLGHLFVARLPKIASPPTPVAELSKQWGVMARLGVAFMFAGLVTTLGQLIVRATVQKGFGDEALGHFQASWAISMVYIGLVLSAMGTDYYPRLTAAIRDNSIVNQLVNEQSEVALLLAAPVLLFMLGFTPWIIELLYSAEFSGAVPILRWQVLGDVLKVASWSLGFVILAAGDGRIYMVTESLAMLVFTGVTWIGLPLIGLEATGVAFLAMYVVYLPVVYFLARRRTGFVFSGMVKKLLISLIGCAVLVRLAGNVYPLLGAGVGFVTVVGFGLFAIFRLSHMIQLGGPVGKIVAVIQAKLPQVLLRK